MENGERELHQKMAQEMIRARESADEKLRIWREGDASKEQEVGRLKKMLQEWKAKADEKERLHAELLRELPGVPLPPLPQKRGPSPHVRGAPVLAASLLATPLPPGAGSRRWVEGAAMQLTAQWEA